jgi:hypothetical protein
MSYLDNFVHNDACFLFFGCVDMMKEVGHKSHGSTMFLPHGPDSVYELRQLLAQNASGKGKGN